MTCRLQATSAAGTATNAAQAGARADGAPASLRTSRHRLPIEVIRALLGLTAFLVTALGMAWLVGE